MAIVADGKTQYQIVTPGRHFPVENEAGKNLQAALLKMTGVRIPVRWGDRRTPQMPTIWIGETDAREPGFKDPDEYRIEVNGQDLRLTGKYRRGSHYAVAAFLESLGVGFYAPEAVYYPRIDRIELPEAGASSTSAFTYRHVFYPATQEPEWAIRLKLNVHNGRDRRWGPNAMAQSIGHSFAALVPVDTYFDEHPEYYSLVDGYRRRERPQLCCTNPEVTDAVCRTMERWIHDLPDKKIFAVAQNDWFNYCECPECSAVDEREGSHMGQVLTLVNRVAERFPDRMFATLSYEWTLTPPRKMHAADNALIVLCHNQGCYTHGLDRCSRNTAFLDLVKGWKDRAENMLIWDYYVNYRHYLLPTPNFRRIGNDIRLYSEQGVKAMFCQGSACTGGQLEHLRQYIQAKLLWDPGLDVERLMIEWAEGVLGKSAAGPVLEYLFALEDRVKDNDVHMSMFWQRRVPDLFSSDLLERGVRLWDKAEREAETPEYRRRVFALRSAEMAGRLVHAKGEYRVEGKELVLHPPVDRDLVDSFVDSCLDADVSYLQEDIGAPEDFRSDFGKTYRAVVLRNEALRAVVLPALGGRIYSLSMKGRETEILCVPQIYENVERAPHGDGYDFSIEQVRLGRGAVEEYRIVEELEDTVTLATDLADDITITTKYELASTGFTATHSVKNASDHPVSVEPVLNPAWARSLFDDESKLEIRGDSGEVVELALNPEHRRDRDLFFKGAECPAAEWRILCLSTGIGIRASFPSGSVSHTRLVVNERLVQMRHCFPRIKLEPGEERAFTSTWSVEAIAE